MSSHHIVRDEQEPALILASATGANPELVGQLLEWSPVVAVLPEAVEQAIAWQIKIDVAFLDEQRKAFEPVLVVQSPIELENAQSEVLKQAVDWLRERNHQAVNLVTNQVGFAQSEQTLSKIAQQIDLVVYTNGWKYVFVRTGEFEKWWKQSTKLQILIDDIWQEGLEHHDNFWEATQSGLVTLKSSKPFWLGEKLIF